jgi:NAD-dependent dihydropyrimidine dehydrogenase PreA subunit
MTCPYESGVRGLPQCLFFSTNKFKNLKDFIDNKSIGNQRFHPIPELGCISVDREASSINVNANSCIKCGLCIFNCPGNSIDIVDSKLSSVCGSSLSNSVAWKSMLRSTFVDYSPKPLYSKNKIYKSFENFTSVKETDNISIWAANIFDYFCESDGRVGLEIPLSIKGRDRDGRLDVCFFKNDFLLIVEAKVTLKKMMEEGRYLPQLISYQEELDLLGKSINNIKLNKLLLIGGDDTDLLPDSHPDCTSISGDLSKIFYKSIVSNNIRFITARGLLSLSMRAISDMKFDLVHFLKEFFSDKEVVGVVADHVIFKDKSLKLISDFI